LVSQQGHAAGCHACLLDFSTEQAHFVIVSRIVEFWNPRARNTDRSLAAFFPLTRNCIPLPPRDVKGRMWRRHVAIISATCGCILRANATDYIKVSVNWTLHLSGTRPEGVFGYPGSPTCLSRGHKKSDSESLTRDVSSSQAQIVVNEVGAPAALPCTRSRTDDMFNSLERCSAGAGQGRCNTVTISAVYESMKAYPLSRRKP